MKTCRNPDHYPQPDGPGEMDAHLHSAGPVVLAGGVPAVVPASPCHREGAQAALGARAGGVAMRMHGGGGVATLREKDLQRHVRAYAEQMGWAVQVTWTSVHSPAGFPDLTLFRARPDGKGELVFVELKAEKGRVTAAQETWLDRLRTVPGVRWAGVCRPSDWFAGKLDEVLRCRDA